MQRATGLPSVVPPPVDPAALAVAEQVLVTFKLPERDYYTPEILGKHLPRSATSWQRDCRLRELQAQRMGRDWIILRPWLIAYLATRNNAFSMN